MPPPTAMGEVVSKLAPPKYVEYAMLPIRGAAVSTLVTKNWIGARGAA